MKVIADLGESLATASGAMRPAELPFFESLFVQLPTDHPRSSACGYEAAHRRCIGSPVWAVAGRPDDHAQFVAAFLALLHRYSQQDTVALDLFAHDAGLPSPSNRAVIRSRLSLDMPMSVMAAEVAAQWQSRAALTGDRSLIPDAIEAPNVAISWISASATGAEVDALAWTRQLAQRSALYDLHVVVTTVENEMPLVAVYNSRLFEGSSIERLMDSFLRLSAATLATPHLPVHRLPILSPIDLQLAPKANPEVKPKANDDAPAAAGDALPRPVHLQFEDWARLQPDATAIVCDGHCLTYAELDRRSNVLARLLVARGVKTGERVAVCVLPSFDVLVGLLAIFKAGGVYLPLDPTHPPALLAAILDEAQPALVLTQSKLRALTQPDRFAQFHFDQFDFHPDVENFGLDLDGGPQAQALRSNVVLPAAATLDRPSYQLYTSGTTGRPKGVVATHGNLAHYIDAARQHYGFRSDDVFCSLARYTFSISMFELLSPLCCGGTLHLLQRDEVLAPERLARTLEGMTVVHAGPSLLGNLIRYLRANPSAPRSFPRMRHASSGGDVVPPQLLEDMKLVFENAELFVIYGCTEISCMGTTFPVRRDAKVNVTSSYVGKPFTDVAVRLVDPQLNLVPFGVVGEICFAGGGVVPGYFNRSELTHEKFVALDGQTFYRTGDMGRLHPDGNVEILGRRDFQIQLRGIRIELTGIENTIRTLGLAAQCAVLAKKVDEQDTRLVAFVVKPRQDGTKEDGTKEDGTKADGSRDAADITSFRRALAEHLPDYMLPQNLVVLDALPVTLNGKLDRKRLEELPWQALPPTMAKEGPRNSVERKIVLAFAACLGRDGGDVGIDDDFFDLGGHSLLAVRLMEDLQNRLGLTFPPGLLFERATVRALAEYSQKSFATEPVPIPLNGNRGGPTLFVLVGVHLYRELARRLEKHFSVCAIYAGRELTMFDAADQAPSVDALARDYVEIIRRHQAKGPYRLVGMSFGGLVAYEVTRQLRAEGQEVSFLGLLDTVLPEHGARRRVAQLGRLAALPHGELLPLLRGRVAVHLRRALASASGNSEAASALAEFAEFAKYAGEARFGPLEDQRQKAYRVATRAYAARMPTANGGNFRFGRPVAPWVQNATLVVAQQRLKRTLLQSPCLGWSSVIPNLAIRNVDCDHLRLLEEPHVAEVAEIFLEGLFRSSSLSST
jgi:amino acid adenylation domain-containing protein